MLSVELIDSLFPADLPSPAHWASQVPGADAARRRRGDPVRAVADRLAAHRRDLHRPASTWTSPGTAAAVTCCASRTPTRRGSRRGRSRSSRRASSTSASRPTSRTPPAATYGPYTQSARAAIYQTYARELMRQGKAYPCFETPEQAEARVARQKATGALPGYYGEWAIWRDAPEDQVRARLEAGDPYVVRFRSPGIGGHAGQLHRRDPRRDQLRRQPQRRGAYSSAATPSCGCPSTTSRTPSTTT